MLLPNQFRRADFLGCPMDLLSSQELLARVKHHIDNREPAKNIQFVNANKVAKIAQDPPFGQLMWKADYVLTDGQPMLPMGKLLGIDVPERIDGIGLMEKLLGLANENQYRVFLFGAKQEVVEQCVDFIRNRFPNLIIAGYRNGYFNKSEIDSIAERIKETKPDILFLGMGSPMKEQIAHAYKDRFGATIIQGVGGSFDVMAGIVPRAPIWMQKLCLEWLFRVLQEPKRMLWRYITTNTRCLAIFAKALSCRAVGKKPLVTKYQPE